MATKINREALRQRIKTLAGLSDDERAALLELVNSKKYGLVWENHPEEVEERLRTHLPVLDEVPERYIPGSSATSPNHILIEGDNLEALTALTYTHEGRIDVIYIDPPYNTGNRDFVYNDKYVDADDDYRHSKWLSFMSKRLRIAKLLLSDRGVIFISIDDNEQANLKLLCDEVFGEQNFVAKFDWRKKTGANDAKDIAVITESILSYAKQRQHTINVTLWNRDDNSINKNRYKYSDEFVETRGKFYYDTLDRGGLQYSDSLNYGITAPDGGIIYPNGRDTYINDGWIWKWGKEKIKWGIENKFLEFVKSKKSKGSSYTIKYKVYQNVDNEGKIREKSGRAYSNLITEPINQQGNAEMTSLFDGEVPFSNPKPVGLIQYLLMTINKTSIVLDFFAGSGTTMHAVMQLNKEDGGHRQCILVTNNENKICEEVTYERNRRVIEGYTTPKGVEVEGLKDNSLRYYRTRLLPRQRTNRNMRDLMAAATDLLCIKEDIFEELRIQNLEIRNIRKHVRLFGKGDRRMMVIYSEEAIPRIVQWLKTTPPLPSSEGWPKAGVCSKPNRVDDRPGWAAKDTHNHSKPTPNPSPGGDAAAPPIPIDATTTTPPAPANATTAAPAIPSSEGWPKAGVCSNEGWPKAGVCSNPIKIYTFSYTNYAYDDDFAEVEDRVQLCALPAAIYEAYRRVLPQEDRYYDNEIIDGSDTNEGKEDNQ